MGHNSNTVWPTIVLSDWRANHCIVWLTGQPLYCLNDGPTIVFLTDGPTIALSDWRVNHCFSDRRANHCITWLTGQPLYCLTNGATIVLSYWGANHCIVWLRGQPLCCLTGGPTIAMSDWRANRCIVWLTGQPLYFWLTDQPLYCLTDGPTIALLTDGPTIVLSDWRTNHCTSLNWGTNYPTSTIALSFFLQPLYFSLQQTYLGHGIYCSRIGRVLRQESCYNPTKAFYRATAVVLDTM